MKKTSALHVAKLRSKGEGTAARILAVALAHFSRLGFERAMLAEIAEEAGVSQPSLHYHFADKDALWTSAMLQLCDVVAAGERLLEAAAEDIASPLARLKLGLRHFLRLSHEHPALGRIVLLEGMAGGARLAWLDAHVIGERNRKLAKLAQMAIAAGELKPFPPAQMIITMQLAAAGMESLAPLMKVSFGVDTAKPAARAAHEDMVINGLLAGLLR